MENITKTIERIAYFVEKKGISLNKFSQQLGVSNSYFSKMIKNKASVGSDIIENILRFYPEINTNWLLTGTGDMLYGSTTSKEASNLPAGPCKQCELRDMIIAKQEDSIELLKDKISQLHKQLKDKSDDIRQTG